MSNPWLKKNPFMSVWLSTANRMAGSIRGHAAALLKRQAKTAATEAANESIKQWAPPVTRPAAKKARKR